MSSPASGLRFGLFRRWWSILAIAALSCLLVAALIAAVFCKLYWGYILSPPGVHPRVLGATRLLAYGRVTFPSTDANPGHAFVSHPPINFDLFATIRNGDGALRLIPPTVDSAAWRDDWIRRGVIDKDGEAPLLPEGRHLTLPGLLESTAQLVRSDYGTGFLSPRTGINTYELLGPDGEKLLFIALYTGEIANDHLAYYELLYDDSVSPPRLLDRRHWRFDVAGIEGAEFVVIATTFSVFLLVVVMPPTIGVLLYRRFSRGARIARGHCPVCGYDLVRDFARGCPECGWGRGEGRAAERDLHQYAFLGRFTSAITRPPGWRSLLILALAAFLVWRSCSVPGSASWGGLLLLAAGLLVMLVKFIGFLTNRLTAPGGEWRRNRSAWRFAIGLALIALTLIGTSTDLPLRWRFALSRPSLERAASAAASAGFPKRAPVGLNQIAGLYLVGGVAPTSDDGEGMIVWVGGPSSGPVMRSFVWYPNGAPASPSAYGTPITLHDELAPGWYLWNYAKYGK